jgi:PadR family transcriptional regulator, regulatory protein PadR
MSDKARRESQQAQLLKGLAELALLSLVQERPHYGLEILDRLRSEAGVELAAGTIYPLLHRLEKANRVKPEWRLEEHGSRPRKYYALTAEGERELATQITEWRRLFTALDAFLDRKKKK